MSRATQPIAIFFAFANDRVERARYLRNLPEEQRQVRDAMAAAVEAGLCEVVERANATVDEVLDVFQDPEYRDRVAVFHFGGHAGGAELLLESAAGEATVAHAGGLARFLGGQRGLELVFLNGCSSRGQVQGLLDAGVPAVVATSEAIDDAVATEFSARFYKALASGASVRTAYTEAQGAVQIRQGEPARGTYRSFVPDEVAEDRWPWDLYVAPGAEERLARWSLPMAARDPLFGLPPLPAMDLPLSPFKHLDWFGREDAHIFFGRGREIRDLYEAVTASDTTPIVLLFGVTGAGKSSLLAAGLAPRLEATHEVIYLRRDGALGLSSTLAQPFGDQGTRADLGAAWRAREEATGKPLVVILDQAEEAWTRPLAGEAEEMAATLRSIFAVREKRPRGRLILSFRKEWLAEVLRLVDAEGLPRFRVEVTHLDRDAIAEAVAGPASTECLRRHYRLEIDPQLPDIIADDLLEDSGAAVAPTLQILLTKMWTLAAKESSDAPRVTVGLYQRLKRDGILLDDFVSEQLESLRQWRPELVGSGLVLDLLAYHATPLGAAERKTSEVGARYGGRSEITELIYQCQDIYLLSVSEGTTRLAHDTLAPLVRSRFEASNLPGQRGLRILQQRAVDWAEGKEGPPLDEVDLAIVEQGAAGMRAWTADEQKLVAASRRERAQRVRRRRALRIGAAAAVVVIAVAAGVAWWQWGRAKKEARTAGRVTDVLTNIFEEFDPYRVTARGKNTLPQILDRSRETIEKNLADEPEAQARLNTTIGGVYRKLGRIHPAEVLLQRVVVFRRSSLGEEHPDTLVAENELANVYWDQARFKEAEELHRQVLERRRRLLGEEHPDTLKSMGNLAGVYRATGRLKAAEELNRQVLESMRRVRGDRHPDTLKVMSNLATVYAAQGRLREGEELHRQVLENRRASLGPEHPDTLGSMTSLANVVHERGRLKEAEELNREALKASRRVLGEEHPDTLMFLLNLAGTWYAQGRLDEAEKLFRQVLAVRLRVQGEDHPDTIAAMNNLAIIWHDRGRFKEAENELRRVVEINRSALGEEHRDTLLSMSNLAAAYFTQNRFAEAEALQRQVLARQRRVLGEEHPDTLKSINNLAEIVRAQGHLKRAEDLFVQFIEVSRRVLGDEHPETLATMGSLAGVYSEQDRPKETEDLLRQTLDLQRRVLGDAHPSTLLTMNNLVALYRAQGRIEEAERLRRQFRPVQSPS